MISFTPRLRLGLKRVSVYTWGVLRSKGLQLLVVCQFLEMSVQKYRDIIGNHVELKDAKTPSLPEDAKDHPARRPYTDRKQVERTWCKHTLAPVSRSFQARQPS